jgi:hypothetical protein
LKRDDLPCLWIEDANSHAIVPLPAAQKDIQQLLAKLAEAAKEAKSPLELIRGTKERSAVVSKSQALFYGYVAIGAFVAFLILLGILIPNLPRLRTYGTGVVTVACYGVLGVTMAIALFGVLRSYGYISSVKTGAVGSDRLGFAWEFGGPAALAVFVMLIGLGYEAQINHGKFGVMVNIYDADSTNTLINVAGRMTLHTKDERSFPINGSSVYLGELSTEKRGDSVDYSVDVQAYVKASPDQLTLADVGTVKIYLRRAQKTLMLATSQAIGGDIVSHVKLITDKAEQLYQTQFVLELSTNLTSQLKAKKFDIGWKGTTETIPALLRYVETEFNRAYPDSQINIFAGPSGVWIGVAGENCPRKGYERVQQ